MHALIRFNVIRRCWEDKPDDRPSFSELVPEFVGSLGSIADYMDLVIGNPSIIETNDDVLMTEVAM